MNSKEIDNLIIKYEQFCQQNSIDPQLFDINAEIDNTLTYAENFNIVMDKLECLRDDIAQHLALSMSKSTIKEELTHALADNSSSTIEWYKKMMSKSLITLIIGSRGCLPKGTLIKTPLGLKPIEEVKEVLSYNIENNRIETKEAVVYNSGLKQVVRIHTKNKDIIECSPEHKWFIIRDKKLMVKETKNLYTTDYLLVV